MEITKVGIIELYNTKSVAYKLLNDNSEVYMRIDETNYENENRFIVIIDINSFYKYWVAQNGGEFTGKVFISDEEHIKRKYDNAMSGFKAGVENPVPAPEVSAHIEHIKKNKVFSKDILIEKLKIGFINGITRTQWLINNGYKFCPIETNQDSAYLLHKYFGLKGTGIYTVKEIMKETGKPTTALA